MGNAIFGKNKGDPRRLHIRNQVKVAHIIVTYNDPEGVSVLLKSISNQKTDGSEIFIIDNSSDDCKEQIKSTVRLALKECPNFYINYIPTARNIGSAGGFALGMELSFKRFDWIWLHDQDGHPGAHCLKALIKASNEIARPAIFAPMVVDPHSGVQVNGFAINRDSWTRRRFVAPEREIQTIDAAGTAGLFIHSKVVEKIGFYDTRNFFIGGEDYDFCLRAKAQNFGSYLVRGAEYYHPEKWADHLEDDKQFLIYLGYIGSTFNDRKIKEASSNIYLALRYSSICFILLNVPYSFIKTVALRVLKPRLKVQLGATIRLYLRVLSGQNVYGK